MAGMIDGGAWSQCTSWMCSSTAASISGVYSRSSRSPSKATGSTLSSPSIIAPLSRSRAGCAGTIVSPYFMVILLLLFSVRTPEA